jgi:hypothetical protein
MWRATLGDEHALTVAAHEAAAAMTLHSAALSAAERYHVCACVCVCVYLNPKP